MKYARLASIASVAVLLAACGGGGGGDGGANDPNAPPTSTVPSPPTLAATGLTPATRPFPADDALGKAQAVVNLLSGVQQAAPAAAALQKLSTLAPAIATPTPGSSFGCPGGGTIAFTAPNPNSTYVYDRCAIDGLSFTTAGGGGATAQPDTPVVGQYTISHGVTGVTGANAPAANIVGGTTACKPATGSTPAQCVTTYSTLKWGYDFVFSGGVSNGALQESGPEGDLNLVVSNLGATSGSAFAFFSDALFVINRVGTTNSFEVWVETDNALPLGNGAWIGRTIQPR